MKVLVIDDDETLTDMFEAILTANGFEVLTSNSGLKGVQAVRSWEPDVVVLDLMMPDINGWQACQAIRSFSQVPVLILSAVVDSQGVMRALEEGADDYLVKPVPVGVLVSYLKMLTQRARLGAQENSGE